jgi:molybdate transport system substrate-binding protein
MRRFATLLAAAVALATAILAPDAARADERRPLAVFAAASLQNALFAAAEAWRRESGRPVTLSFGASSALARQIDQGAPADIFASADLEWMDWADRRGLIAPGTRRSLLGNRLVLVEPASAPPSDLAISPGFPLARALGDSRLATGEPRTVPAGRYARTALESLGVWTEVAGRIAGVENVRAALALVARGEVRFGIVYATDARSEPRVRVVGTFPAASHPPIVHPFAVTTASRHPDAAAFLAWLQAPVASGLLEEQGFGMLD